MSGAAAVRQLPGPMQQEQASLRLLPVPPVIRKVKKLSVSVRQIPEKRQQLQAKRLLPDRIHKDIQQKPAPPAGRRYIRNIPQWNIPPGVPASSPARQESRPPVRFASLARPFHWWRAYPRQNGRAPVRHSRKTAGLPFPADHRRRLVLHSARQERLRRLRFQQNGSSPDRPGRNAADPPHPPQLRRLPLILVSAPARQEPRRIAPVRREIIRRPETERSGQRAKSLNRA